MKLTPIDGDLAVGRDATVGHNATVNGNVTVGHDLTVDGWLYARNFKGPNKGIYTTLARLQAAHPHPIDGLLAMVGTTLPARLYVAQGGVWVDTGNTAGDPTIDINVYADDIAALQRRMADVQLRAGYPIEIDTTRNMYYHIDRHFPRGTTIVFDVEHFQPTGPGICACAVLRHDNSAIAVLEHTDGHAVVTLTEDTHIKDVMAYAPPGTSFTATATIMVGSLAMACAHAEKELTAELELTDYADLRQCLQAAADMASPSRHMVVNVPEGVYDVDACFTQAEKDAEGFRGLEVPPYVTLRGTGNRESTVIRWIGDPANPKGNISTLNLRVGDTGLANITVEAQFIRYAVHDDFAYGVHAPNVHHVENCTFDAFNCVYNAAYGSGHYGWAHWTFVDCTFRCDKYAFSCHNNTYVRRPARIEFDNCDFITTSPTLQHAVSLGSLNHGSTGITTVKFTGCRAHGKGVLLHEENAAIYGSGILFRTTGYACDFILP